LIELNAALLNAPDLLSMLPMFEAPVESTNTSAPTAQDFSALLTQLIGSLDQQQGLPDTAASPQGSTVPASEPIVPGIQTPELNVAEVNLPEGITPELSTSELQTPQVKTPELNIPEVKVPDVQAPETKTPEVKTPEVKVPEVKTPELNPDSKVQEPKALEPKTPEVKIPEPKGPVVKTPQVKVPEVKTPEPKAPGAKTPEVPETYGQSTELPAAAACPELPPATNEIVPGKPKEKEPQKAQNVDPSVITPFVPVVLVAAAPAVAAAEKPTMKIEEPAAQKPVQVPGTPVTAKSDVDPVWAEVKKFELTIKHEAAAPTKSQPGEPVTTEEAAKQAMITTDPLANLRQEQLPPRIIAVQKVNFDVRLPERSKSDPASQVNETTTAPTLQLNGVSQQLGPVEQVRAAHHVELPQLPQSQVVRSVAIEVGEADSQVMIRIQERGGDVSLQLNAGSEPLHQDLKSSLGSLVQSLRQEEVKVASAEVSRKSPIGKVGRSKEAH